VSKLVTDPTARTQESAVTTAETPTRRIVANFFLSLDGVAESPDKWHFPYFNDEMGEAVSAGFAASDALLMGGTLYREWSEYWPTSTDEVAVVRTATLPLAGLPHVGAAAKAAHLRRKAAGQMSHARIDVIFDGG